MSTLQQHCNNVESWYREASNELISYIFPPSIFHGTTSLHLHTGYVWGLTELQVTIKHLIVLGNKKSPVDNKISITRCLKGK